MKIYTIAILNKKLDKQHMVKGKSSTKTQRENMIGIKRK